MMPPQAFQTDEQIAAVLTYIRNNFGNKASAVSPAQVAALRSEAGKPMLTQADLIPPPVKEKPAASAKTNEAAPSAAPFKLRLSQRLGVPVWVAGLAALWTLLCVAIGLKKSA
jgi:hypothetical protein